MTPSTPQHPSGHGLPLDSEEQARLQVIAERHAHDLGPLLTWPGPAATTGAGPCSRRVLRRSGWPAWVALLLGLALVAQGVRSDQGWPLLVGAVLMITSHHWLGLPHLAALRSAMYRVLRPGPTARP